MLTDYPELLDGMRLVPCAVMTDNDSPQAGWLFIPHADGKWVSAAKLQTFSQQIINYWWNSPSSAEARAEVQEPVATKLETQAFNCFHVSAEDAERLRALPVGASLYTAPQSLAPCAECAEWRAAEHKLSAAYLRIRQKLNAFDTPYAPTADQVYERTEAAIDAMQAKVAILDGLSQVAIDGGWTYRGMEAYANGLEDKVAEQAAEIERLNRGMTVYTEAFEAECRTTDEQNMLIEMCEKALVIAYPNWEQYGDLEINAWARDIIAAIASHKKGGSE